MEKVTLEEAFWQKVDKKGPTECWEWTACRHKGKHAYGQLRYEQILYRAHRLSYVLSNGDIPDGLFVLHSCDNPPCVNPAHLYLGTAGDNIREAVARGRHKQARSPGERHPCHKLKTEQVLKIRELYATGLWTQKELGAIYGVTQANISLIVTKGWKHL